MQRITDRKTRLAFETPFLVGKRPLIVVVEPWGLRLREKSLRAHNLPITWAQIWNRAAIIAADTVRQRRKDRPKGKQFNEGKNS
jgi:hypothetical protein